MDEVDCIQAREDARKKHRNVEAFDLHEDDHGREDED